MSRSWMAVGAALMAIAALTAGTSVIQPASGQMTPGGGDMAGGGGPVAGPASPGTPPCGAASCPVQLRPPVPLQLAAPGVAPWREPKTPAKPTAEQRILKALTENTELDFVEVPLGQVVRYLAERHRITIRLCARSFSDMGLTPDCPITIDLKGVQLRSALNQILRNLDLTFVIQDEVLIITSIENARSSEYLRTEVYDVTDLVGSGTPPWANPGGMGRGMGMGGPGMGGCVMPAEPSDLESLVCLVTRHLRPESWRDSGGEAEIVSGTIGPARVLVVTQTLEEHFAIQDLLEKLRRVAAVAKARQPRFVPPGPASPGMMEGGMTPGGGGFIGGWGPGAGPGLMMPGGGGGFIGGGGPGGGGGLMGPSQPTIEEKAPPKPEKTTKKKGKTRSQPKPVDDEGMNPFGNDRGGASPFDTPPQVEAKGVF